MLLIADPHLGANRTTGATVESNKAFNTWQFENFTAALHAVGPETTKVILGDLFDSHDVDFDVVLRTLSILASTKGKLIILAGNHDLSRRTDQLSALQFLAEILPKHRSDDTTFVFEPREIDGIHFVPHLPNQVMFDAAIGAVPDSATLMTHANFENPFAGAMDHSLNLTATQCRRFSAVISGHEHSQRRIGNVHMVGALHPRNIEEAASPKSLFQLGVHGPEVIGDIELDYEEVDWRQLSVDESCAKFVRVTGCCEFSEGADVVQAVDAFRKQSSAFFITNAVSVAGLQLQELLDASEGLDSFDALEMFWLLLKPETKERVHAVVIS